MFPGIGFLVLSAWCLGRAQQPPPVLPVLRGAGAVERGPDRRAGRRRHRRRRSRHRGRSKQRPRRLPGLGACSSAASCSSGCRSSRCGGCSAPSASASTRPASGSAASSAGSCPVLLGRGAIQIMGWVDLLLASYLASGAVAALTYTMVLYLLPVSLFGVSVAAAELPDLSEVDGARPRHPPPLPPAARGQHGSHRLVRGLHRHDVHRRGRRGRGRGLRAGGVRPGRHGRWCGSPWPSCRWACSPWPPPGCCRTGSTPSTTPAPRPAWACSASCCRP